MRNCFNKHWKTCAMALLVFTTGVSQARATTMVYSVTGVVESVSKDRITVRTGNRVLEISKSSSTSVRGPEPHSGEKITVWYHLEAERIGPAPSLQKPGSVAPEEKSIPDGLKQWNDDRGFYSA